MLRPICGTRTNWAPAQKRSVAAAQRLSGPLFRLLSSPSAAAHLRALGAGMASGGGGASSSAALDVVDAGAPALAPLVRAACQADPDLEQAAASLIGVRYADAASFWTTYFSRVVALEEALAAEPGAITFAVNQRTLARGVAVTDAEVERAMLEFASAAHLVVEPGGAGMF